VTKDELSVLLTKLGLSEQDKATILSLPIAYIDYWCEQVKQAQRRSR
jgi:hypothetical protein